MESRDEDKKGEGGGRRYEIKGLSPVTSRDKRRPNIKNRSVLTLQKEEGRLLF